MLGKTDVTNSINYSIETETETMAYKATFPTYNSAMIADNCDADGCTTNSSIKAMMNGQFLCETCWVSYRDKTIAILDYGVTVKLDYTSNRWVAYFCERYLDSADASGSEWQRLTNELYAGVQECKRMDATIFAGS